MSLLPPPQPGCAPTIFAPAHTRWQFAALGSCNRSPSPSSSPCAAPRMPLPPSSRPSAGTSRSAPGPSPSPSSAMRSRGRGFLPNRAPGASDVSQSRAGSERRQPIADGEGATSASARGLQLSNSCTLIAPAWRQSTCSNAVQPLRLLLLRLHGVPIRRKKRRYIPTATITNTSSRSVFSTAIVRFPPTCSLIYF